MIDKSHKHQEKVDQIAHEIEGKLHHGEKIRSALHDEFHKLQKLDTHHGQLNKHQFKHDVHSVEAKLHKDGYLPHLNIANDHGSHIKVSHSKHSLALHEGGKHSDKLHPTAKQHLDAQHKKILHPSEANHPKGSCHATDKNHPTDKVHPTDQALKETAYSTDKLHQGTTHPSDKPDKGTGHPSDKLRIPAQGADRRSFANPARDVAPSVDPRLRRGPIDQPRFAPPPVDQQRFEPPQVDGSVQPRPYLYQNPSDRGYAPPPYDQSSGFRQPPDQLQPPYDQPGAYRRPDPAPYGQERFNNTDRQREFQQPGSDASKLNGRFTEIRLDQTTHAGNSPDALMYVRADFDPSKPVHLAVYNHGFGTRADNTLTQDQMKAMMANAEKNTLLIVPEWQSNPGSRSGASGAFQQGNKFTSMVQESFNETPGLNGIGLNNVDRIDIMSHSAGYSPTEAEIYKNPALANKIHSITLLDSLYDQHGFDRWLASNINELASGRKQFYNFSNTTTNERSAAQARYVQGLLRQQGLPTNNFTVDYGSANGQVGRHAAEMASRSIVFGRTTVAHMQIPPQYMGSVLASVNRENRGQS